MLPDFPRPSSKAPMSTMPAARRSGRESRRQNSLSWTCRGPMCERERILYPKSGVVTSAGASKGRVPGKITQHSLNFVDDDCEFRRCRANPLLLRRFLHLAVITAVREVNDEANHEPDDEARPVDPSELVHHVPIEGDSKDRNDWD